MKLTLLDAKASDLDVVNAARVSFAQQSDWEVNTVPEKLLITEDSPHAFVSEIVQKLSERDAGLVKFLLKNRHGTPFEHGYFRFHVEAPIFVFREWQRHRIGHSYNEMSGRYVEMDPEFYTPSEFRVQVGKPGAYTYEPLEDTEQWHRLALRMTDAYLHSWRAYQALLEAGIAKEQARAVLPLGIYSQMHWSCNPRSLMHFIGLRNAPNAMQEIRELAADAEDTLREHMPVTHAAFIDNERTAP